MRHRGQGKGLAALDESCTIFLFIPIVSERYVQTH